MTPKSRNRRRQNQSRFKLIPSLRSLVFCGKSDPKMDDWLNNLKPPEAAKTSAMDMSTAEFLGGHHQWHPMNHARPTFCNVCHDTLPGVTSSGLSCEICKYKVHKRCSEKAINNCKWTTLASVGKNIIEDQDGNISMPHQWLEGNLPVSSKCAVCEKTCGSVIRFQDWRCLWCKTTVHTACRPAMNVYCPLGPCKLSIVPPIALHSIGTDEAWDAVRPTGCSPLLVFVNSKSGDNQGIKFLRRFKQLLNPAQVFDLIKAGPGPGLKLFRHFDPFRILVCSGDGSVGWVLSEIDRLGMHKQCQVGVLPLGTGNDLARVLGWGGSCDDDTNLTHLLEKYEKASTKMLDRWSIMTFERNILSLACSRDLEQSDSAISSATTMESNDPILSHIQDILAIIATNDRKKTHLDVKQGGIVEMLDNSVETLVRRVSDINSDEIASAKIEIIRAKLELLHKTIKEEKKLCFDSDTYNNFSLNSEEILYEKNEPPLEKPDSKQAKDEKNMQKRQENENKADESKPNNGEEKDVQKAEEKENKAIMSRANSLKKAVKELVDHANQAIDQQIQFKTMDFGGKRKQSESLNLLTPVNSVSSGETTPCASPTLNPASISPLPDVRRDSQAGELIQLPAPDGFEDSRRPSSNEHFTFEDDGTINNVIDRLNEQHNMSLNTILENTNVNQNGGLENSEKSSPEDGTLLDTDSLHSEDTGSDNAKKSKIPKNSDSEIDSEILDSNDNDYVPIPHIDSENSDSCEHPNNSESAFDDFSSMAIDYNMYDENMVSIETANGKKFQNANYNQSAPRATGEDENDIDSCPHQLAKNESNTPPMIMINPPSPIKSVPNEDPDRYFSQFEPRPSMATLTVEYVEGSTPHWHGSRRISTGSLFKANVAALTAKYGGSCLSLKHERSKSIDEAADRKKLPIINPLVRLPMWPNVSGGFISQALLANADALCAAVSPLMDPDETLIEDYIEKSVMNNYFGIGIDAKISLDFHNKREEHPEKCRSRAKNYMWYGLLGSKQLLQKTYKNLDQRVQLECDGQRIPLPSLQGIVVLNIPSFMGGTNFWGGSKEGDIFLAPSFDDRILEVVAVFGSVQMAASRLINLEHHRIAQCQTIQINILGDEGVPVQVDGEAWVQPPGIIRIVHKNRMQMLCRNRALENSLKAWEEKQRNNMSAVHNTSTTTLSQISRQSMQIEPNQLLSSDERNILLGLIDVVNTLINHVRLLTLHHTDLRKELYKLTERTQISLEKLHPDGQILEGITLRPVVTEVVSSARQLYEDTCELMRDRSSTLKLKGDLAVKLSGSLADMEQALRKCIFDERESGLVYLQHVPDDQTDKKTRHRGLFWEQFRRNTITLTKQQVSQWDVKEVGSWLESLKLKDSTEQYVKLFEEHDIRGRELLTLTKQDLRDIGVTVVGHNLRINSAIKELNQLL